MATERHGRDNWAIDIDKSDPERFSVAVEGHDVLRYIQHYSHSIPLTEEVVFATERVKEGAPVREFLCRSASKAP